MLMFFGMAALYFFMKHLKTSKRRYLVLVAFFFAALFYTSYSSIPFIAFSQMLWFYRASENDKKSYLCSFLILNGLTLLFCIPWTFFLALNYKGQPMMDPLRPEILGSLWTIVYGVLHDWVPHAPLMVFSVIVLILFPFFSDNEKNALVLLSILVLPVGGLYLFCKLSNVTHFASSRYFINFLPLLFISIYLSLRTIEVRFERLRRFMRLRVLFVILFIASNLLILIFPFYYRSEKQDFRSLVTYLKGQLREGDKIFVGSYMYFPGILHYFGTYPEGHHYIIPIYKDSEKGDELRKSFLYQNRMFIIYDSKSCCAQYVADGSRLWIIVDKSHASELKKNSPCVLKRYFDGSFLNIRKFPTDGSLYLFLWDPSSPADKGIDMPIG